MVEPIPADDDLRTDVRLTGDEWLTLTYLWVLDPLTERELTYLLGSRALRAIPTLVEMHLIEGVRHEGHDWYRVCMDRRGQVRAMVPGRVTDGINRNYRAELNDGHVTDDVLEARQAPLPDTW